MIRAVVYDAVGAAPRLTTVPAPTCPADGVVVEVRATGVCRSDWHAWHGREEVPLPHIPGHEFAGVIKEIGARVRRFRVGDRVTAPFVNGCGRCRWCLDGAAQVCANQTQPGFTHSGSFAEQVVVQAAEVNLVGLPDQVDFLAAAALGCRFATAFRAITAHVQLQPNDWLVVVGCGGVGLSAIMIARALGIRTIALDPNEPARRRATELGAEQALETITSVETIHRISDGGAALSLDAYGSADSADLALRSLRRQGHHVQAGLMLGADGKASLPWDLVIGRELSVHGSHGMAATDYPAMLAMITDGRLEPARLIGEVITLDQVPAALAAMDDPAGSVGGIVVATLEGLRKDPMNQRAPQAATHSGSSIPGLRSGAGAGDPGCTATGSTPAQ